MRSKSPEKALDDLIDIVVSNSNFKTKLIFINSKNQRNGSIYEKISAELGALQISYVSGGNSQNDGPTNTGAVFANIQYIAAY